MPYVDGAGYATQHTEHLLGGTGTGSVIGVINSHLNRCGTRRSLPQDAGRNIQLRHRGCQVMANPVYEVCGVFERRRTHHQPCPVRCLGRSLQVVVKRRAGKTDKPVHFQGFRTGANGPFQLRSGLRGLGLVGAFGQIHFHNHPGPVCVGEKLLGHERRHAHADGDQQSARDNQTARIAIHQATQRTGQAHQPVFVDILSRLEEPGRQQRHGGNGQQVTDRQREHDHHRHATGEISRTTLGHQQGREGRQRGAGRRTQWPGQLANGLTQGIQPAHAFVQVTLDVLHNHNGVINQDT